MAREWWVKAQMFSVSQATVGQSLSTSIAHSRLSCALASHFGLMFDLN